MHGLRILSVPVFLILSLLILSPALARAGEPAIAPWQAPDVKMFLTSCAADSVQCDFEVRNVLLNRMNTRDSTPVCIKGGHFQQPVVAWLRGDPLPA